MTLYTLAFDGVAGDATSKGDAGALSVSSVSFEVTQPTSAVGNVVRKPIFSPLTVSIKNDTGLASFLKLIAGGKHIQGATLSARSDGSNSTDLYRLDLDDLVVNGVEDRSAGGYVVTVAYKSIELTTYATGQDGRTVTSRTFGWNTSTNQPGTATGGTSGKPVAPTAPTRYYLLVDGVDGGSTAKGHEGWFEVSSAGLVTSAPRAGASGSDPVSFGPLQVNLQADSGLTDLLQQAAGGKMVRGVRLEGIDAMSTPVYDLTLSNVVVQSIQDASETGFSTQFDYSKIELITKGVDASGKPVTTDSYGFDRASGEAFSPSGLPPLAAGNAPGNGTPGANLDYYLGVTGIAGNATRKGHAGALQVAGYSFGVSQSRSAVGTEPGTASVGPLSVSFYDETGLAKFLGLLATGKHVAGATLTAAGSIDYYKLDLGDLVVTSVVDQSTGGPGAYSVTLDYKSSSLTTFSTDDKGRAVISGKFSNNDGAEGVKPVSPVPGTGAKDYYLLANGLNGGATAQGHEGWFEVASFALPTIASASSGAGNATFGPVTVQFDGDEGLVDFVQAALNQTVNKGIRLEGVTRAGDKSSAVYDLALSNVVVQDVVDTLNGFSVQLDYSRIGLITKGQDAQGKYATTGVFGYDRSTGESYDPSKLPALSVGKQRAGGGGTYYLAIDGVAGDVTVAGHKGALTVASYTFDVSNTATALGGPGQSNPGALSVRIANETALSSFLDLLATGKRAPSASLTARKDGGAKPTDSYKLALDGVYVTAVTDHQGGGYDVTLAYGNFRLATGDVGKSSELKTAAPATTPTHYYLQVAGIDGGSTDARHRGWFDISSFNLATTGSVPSGGGGAGAGRASFGPLEVGFAQNVGLADLLAQAASAKSIRSVRLEGVTDGANPTAVYDLTLSNVIAQNIAKEGDTNTADFDYSRIELVTRGRLDDGRTVQTGSFGYDRATKTSFTPSGLTSITLTESEVGDGSDNDSGTQAMQDGGLAVRLQRKDSDGVPVGSQTRSSDENVRFVAEAGKVFEVIDLPTGRVAGSTFGSVVLGSNGDDTLRTADSRAAYVNGGQGDDVVFGSAEADRLVGGYGADKLFGDAGDDVLQGGLITKNTAYGDGSLDVLEGGAGADTIIGGGADLASYYHSTRGVSVDLGLAVQSDAGTDADGDTLTGIYDLYGSAFADTLSGDRFDNTIYGGLGGEDKIFGGLGDDKIAIQASLGESGSVDGGDGTDYLAVRGGDVILSDTNFSGFESVGVNGGGRVDMSAVAAFSGTIRSYSKATGAGATIVGTKGADTIRGGAGRDTISGGAGDDRIVAGVGAETFDDMMAGFGRDTVYAADLDTDRFRFSTSFAADATAAHLHIEAYGAQDTLVYGDAGKAADAIILKGVDVDAAAAHRGAFTVGAPPSP